MKKTPITKKYKKLDIIFHLLSWVLCFGTAAFLVILKIAGAEEGTPLKTTVFEFSYKNDELGDPLINRYHAVGIGAATFEEIDTILDMTAKINNILKDAFAKENINLSTLR